MSQLLFSTQQSAAILANRNQALPNRVAAARDILSQLCLGDLSILARSEVEAALSAIERTIAGADIEKIDDYRRLDDIQLEELQRRLEDIIETVIDSETHRVMSGLNNAE